MVDTDVRVAVVIPAAGKGERMGGVRKQYRPLAEVPLLIHTLRVFDALPYVHDIIVALPEADCEEWREKCRRAGLEKVSDIVAGGETRQASVSRGLEAVAFESDIVLIHDAVRPFVTADQIEQVVAGAREAGAAALAVPVSDTLRRGGNGHFDETIDRNNMYSMQTPQGFRYDLIANAHRWAATNEIKVTDDVALAQRAGHAVKIVPGSQANIKVTTPQDWALARRLFNG